MGNNERMKFWYQLVHEGKAQEVDRVVVEDCIADEKDIGDLQDAIKEREKLPNRPRDLHVYGKGTTLEDYRHPSELTLRLSIDTLLNDGQIQGTTITEPLLVVISPLQLMVDGELQAQNKIQQLERQNKILSLTYQNVMLQNARMKTTTERLLTVADDELSLAYDDGNVVEFWLSANTTEMWPGNWEKYKTTDASRQERRILQPAINSEFQPNFPSSSHFEMVNTSNGWNKMTQDATLFLKDHAHVELTVAAIFEWVGQDESPFPSKKHKAKFVRDLVRLFSRCGRSRPVQGVITDLSRIVAVKLVSVDENMVPQIERTATLEGERVQEVLSGFAFASPQELSVSCKQWKFGSTLVQTRTVIGSGLHGRVFSIVSSDHKFVKTFNSADAFSAEERVLKSLHSKGVPYIPKVESSNNSVLAFLASPLCTNLRKLQGLAVVWRLGAKFVECLQQAHIANFCHRDVQPSNMGYVSSTVSIDGDTDVLLFDWASASEIGSSISFTGTVHYAASTVLDALKELKEPVPAAAHDLESLVYTIWDLTRHASTPPRALLVNGSLNSANAEQYVTQVQEAWKQDKDQNPPLAELLVCARECNYAELARKMIQRA